ncbi:MAG: viral A-type inclusion protein [Runella zeae]
MKIQSLLIAVAISIASCQTQEQKQIDTLEKEVMMIHDAVMPKMGELVALQSTLSKHIAYTDSLLKITPSDTSLQNTLKQSNMLATDLKKADDGMMNWMHQYKGDSLKKLPPKEAIQALTNEKIKIEQVSDDMLKSIEDAQQLLKKQ